MPAPEVAVAYVSIVPSLQGFTRDLRRQLVGPAGDAGGDAGAAAGGRLREALKAGALAAGVAAGAVIVSGVTDAIEQSKITKTLGAQIGASGKDAARYGKVAGTLYTKGVTENFQQGADAIKSIMQSGIAPPGATNAQLQKIATKVVDVSTVFDQDLGGVTNAVSQMMRTGLAKNSSQALDILTKGFQSGANKADDLLDTMNEYGTQFRKMGLDGKTAVGLMNQAIRAGARDSDVAADAIKEFAIRAVDGSETTAEGFKALGLNADTMAKKFGKGGSSARKALDQTLTRLRGMKDPVEQSAAAVNLFGTQAEDLGDALYAMDPSSAANDLGKVGGAAGRLGKTMRSGPIAEVQRFGRELKQGLADAAKKYAIPALAETLGAMKSAVGWIKSNSDWILPIASGFAAVALSLGTYKAVVSGVAAVTRGWAAAQLLFNAAMNANPIGLIALAVIGLGTALVVAYKKSETFRNIVQGAWEGIKTAASAVWNSVLKPTFSAFAAAFRAVGAAASWLWGTILRPVFGFISSAARILMTVVVTAAILPIVAAFKLLAAVGKWLWTNAISPVFGWIAGRAKWLWKNAILPAFNGIKAVFRGLATAAKWLYNAAIKPAFTWIANRAKWLWRNAILPAFNGIKSVFRGAATAAKWLYNSAIRPAFNWIADKGKWLWRSALKPAFDAMKKGVSLVGKSFNTAKNAIAKAWGKVSGIAKKPVAFIVNTVYNSGIVPVWNKVAGAFGAPKLKKAAKFARGGVLPGYTPGRDPHTFFSPTGGALHMSGGEAIMRPEFTRGVGAGFVHRMNAIARTKGVAGVRRAMSGGPAFKDGGIFGWLSGAASTVKGWGSAAWDKVKKGARWLKETMAGSARAGVKAVVNPLIDRIPGLQGGFGKMVKKIPLKMVDSMFGYSEKADKKMETAIPAGLPGGSGVKRWTPYVLKALAMLGQPRSYLGITLRRMNQESGGNPRAINNWDINARNGVASRGLMQVIPPTFNAYAGKLRSRGIWDPLANIYASMRYALARYGSLPRAYNRAGGYDSGGWLQPGDTLAMNRTGKPEPILNPSQWRSMATLAQRGAEGTGGGLQPGDRLILSIDGRTELEAYVDRRADTRIRKGLTAPAALGRKL